MVLPPVLVGAVNVTVADPDTCVTVEIVGAPGTVAATKAADGAEATLVPTPLVAVTVQVYVLAFVSELTVIGELASDADSVAPPLLDVHVTV